MGVEEQGELGAAITSATPAQATDAGITSATVPPTTDNFVIDNTALDHECTRNYDGSSGAMESNGLLLLMKQLKTKYNGDIWLDDVITDDNTKMKKYITHPAYMPRGKKNIGGAYLLISQSQIGILIQHIVQSVWLVVFLNYVKERSLRLKQLSSMLSA